MVTNYQDRAPRGESSCHTCANAYNHIQFHHLHTFHTYVYMCTVDENVNVCIVHTKGCVQKKSPHPRKQLFISDTPTTITSGRREPLWESHIDKHQGKRRLSSLLCGPHLCIFIKAFQMFSDKNIKKLINAAFFLHPHSRVIWLLFVLNFNKHASLSALLKIFLSLLKRMKAMASNPKVRSNTGTCRLF